MGKKRAARRQSTGNTRKESPSRISEPPVLPELMAALSLKGKTLFITGASRGIGRAIALMYVKALSTWEFPFDHL